MKIGDMVLIKAEIVGITEADNPIIKTEGGIKMLVKQSDILNYLIPGKLKEEGEE